MDNVWKAASILGMTRPVYPQKKELQEAALYLKIIHSHSFVDSSTSHTVVVPKFSQGSHSFFHFSPNVMTMKLKIREKIR